MKAEIITIGDEILIGQIIDTNSQWIGSCWRVLPQGTIRFRQFKISVIKERYPCAGRKYQCNVMENR